MDQVTTTIELPGIVHRFEPGHRLAVVLAGGDLAYRGSTAPQPVSDPPGTAISFAGPVLQRPLDVVGSPRVTVRLSSTTASALEADTGLKLVVYAKLYDVGPDGTSVELPHRLISPVRVTDVDRPLTIELPGIVHRFERGHRLAAVLAGGDLAYRGSAVPPTVSRPPGPGGVQPLTLPVVT